MSLELEFVDPEKLIKALEAHEYAKSKVSIGEAKALFKRDQMILTEESRTGMPVSEKKLNQIDLSVPKIGQAISKYDAAFEEYLKTHQ